MPNRPILPDASRSEPVNRKIADFHVATVREVEAAIRSEPVVVVGMAQNPFVKRARRALEAAGITFRYLEFGSYLSAWKPRLAIKLWSGWPTFPQVFVGGTLIGGYEETLAAIEAGSLHSQPDAAPTSRPPAD